MAYGVSCGVSREDGEGSIMVCGGPRPCALNVARRRIRSHVRTYLVSKHARLPYASSVHATCRMPPVKRARRTPFDGVAIELHLAGPSRAQGLTKESKEIVPNENSSAYKHRSHDHIYESDFGVRAGLE